VSLIECFEEISQETNDLSVCTEYHGEKGSILLQLYQKPTGGYAVVINGHAEGQLLPTVSSNKVMNRRQALTFSYKALLYYTTILDK